MFERLAVFAGGFTLAAAAEVCLDGAEDDALDAVERLVRSSLVAVAEGAAGTRYRLLETIRQYATDRLVAAGAHDGVMHGHAEYYRRFAQSANLSASGRSAERAFPKVRDELPNIRSALKWCLGHDRILGLHLACALEQFWYTNVPREGITVFEALLDTPELPAPLRARALLCLGGCITYLGDVTAGLVHYERSLAIFRELGDDGAIGHLLLLMANAASSRGDLASARALLVESGERSGVDRAPTDEANALMLEADLAYDAGRFDEAMALLVRAHDVALRGGDPWFEAFALYRLAERSLQRDRPADAREHGRASLVAADVVGDRQLIVFSLATLAWAAAATGDGTRAGRLWGAIEGEVARGGPIGQWELERSIWESRVLVGREDELANALAVGQAMPLEDAIDEAVTPPRA